MAENVKQIRTKKPFTGWHMTAILVAFFGVIMAVNFTMAHLASSTFGGTVVDNSYVASQKFNGWLQQAETQENLGWTHEISLSADRHIMVKMTKDAKPLSPLKIIAAAHHPLGRAAPLNFTFNHDEMGNFRSARALPPGRWSVIVSARQNSNIAQYKADLK
ncbi:hypothetical protein LPB140_02705 [Sphingorhabdus lutea]|uniref:Nitrogen fixation protein FixH n=1 Tax=Sphingorhabdus lutea TaxID=1913578 RepID=A0A1L3J9W5_9SPHN|nr:FixH family protein [Sphingorhabdus lutea]APG61914.1 hypothetical protein LPB140_02705 [Sphingorhabdus lutea]